MANADVYWLSALFYRSKASLMYNSAVTRRSFCSMFVTSPYILTNFSELHIFFHKNFSKKFINFNCASDGEY